MPLPKTIALTLVIAQTLVASGCATIEPPPVPMQASAKEGPATTADGGGGTATGTPPAAVSTPSGNPTVTGPDPQTPPPPPPPKRLAQGTWKPISNVGAHPDAHCPSAVWDGTRMLVVGGDNVHSAITAYDPKTDSWATLPSSNTPPARTEGSAVWTGTELIWFGGRRYASDASPFWWYWESYAYAPGTGAWTQKADPPMVDSLYFARFNHAAAWLGTKMIAYGGSFPNLVFPSAQTYDRAANVWTRAPDGPEARSNVAAATFAGKAYFFGGATAVEITQASDGFADGVVFDPAANAWSKSMAASPLAKRGSVAMAASDKEIAVWGGQLGATVYGDGATFDPATGAWSMLPTEGAPSARRCATAVWTGDALIVWGGVGPTGAQANGAMLRP